MLIIILILLLIILYKFCRVHRSCRGHEKKFEKRVASWRAILKK